jgi:hypothetical protein
VARPGQDLFAGLESDFFLASDFVELDEESDDDPFDEPFDDPFDELDDPSDDDVSGRVALEEPPRLSVL